MKLFALPLLLVVTANAQASNPETCPGVAPCGPNAYFSPNQRACMWLKKEGEYCNKIQKCGSGLTCTASRCHPESCSQLLRGDKATYTAIAEEGDINASIEKLLDGTHPMELVLHPEHGGHIEWSLSDNHGTQFGIETYYDEEKHVVVPNKDYVYVHVFTDCLPDEVKHLIPGDEDAIATRSLFDLWHNVQNVAAAAKQTAQRAVINTVTFMQPIVVAIQEHAPKFIGVVEETKRYFDCNFDIGCICGVSFDVMIKSSDIFDLSCTNIESTSTAVASKCGDFLKTVNLKEAANDMCRFVGTSMVEVCKAHPEFQGFLKDFPNFKTQFCGYVADTASAYGR